MTAESPTKILEGALARQGLAGAKARLAIPAVASPLHRGVAQQGFQVTPTAGPALFCKLPAADQEGLLAPAEAAVMARLAGGLGVAPDVAWYDAPAAVLATAWLPDGWRYAKVEDLRRPDCLRAVLAALRRLQAAPVTPDLPCPDAGARLQRQDALLRDLPVERPPNYDWLMDQAHQALQALDPSAQAQAPCHLGAIASNVMLGPDGGLLLVDFDQAGLGDPLHDLGILLTEAFDFEDEWLAALAPLYGEAAQAAVNRGRLWGLVDDLAWGQWGFICHARGLRPDIEYFKYASWRFLRATQTAGDWGFERRLRQL
ncbi:MAG: phosphotransferase [Rhodospirillales bacterium]